MSQDTTTPQRDGSKDAIPPRTTPMGEWQRTTVSRVQVGDTVSFAPVGAAVAKIDSMAVVIADAGREQQAGARRVSVKLTTPTGQVWFYGASTACWLLQPAPVVADLGGTPDQQQAWADQQQARNEAQTPELDAKTDDTPPVDLDATVAAVNAGTPPPSDAPSMTPRQAKALSKRVGEQLASGKLQRSAITEGIAGGKTPAQVSAEHGVSIESVLGYCGAKVKTAPATATAPATTTTATTSPARAKPVDTLLPGWVGGPVAKNGVGEGLQRPALLTGVNLSGERTVLGVYDTAGDYRNAIASYMAEPGAELWHRVEVWPVRGVHGWTYSPAQEDAS